MKTTSCSVVSTSFAGPQQWQSWRNAAGSDILMELRHSQGVKPATLKPPAMPVECYREPPKPCILL